MQIWKFPLKADDEQIVRMPKGARLLSLQIQKGIPCLWASVHTRIEEINRKVYTFGTGQDTAFITEQLDFVGTYQQFNGDLVLHVFIDREN